MIRPSTLLLLLGLGATAGCTQTGGSLHGSIDASYSLVHDGVRLRKQEEFVEVSYLLRSEVGFEAPVKLAARVDDIPPGPVTISGAAFQQRISLRRVVIEGSSRFPPIKQGALELHEFSFDDMAPIAGDFDIEFVDGRTLHGDFSGVLREVLVPEENAP